MNKIYGFSIKGKRYKGFLEGSGGLKLGKSSILIPIESREEFIKLAKKYKVNAKIIEVFY